MPQSKSEPNIPPKAIPLDFPYLSRGKSIPLLSPDKFCPSVMMKKCDTSSTLFQQQLLLVLDKQNTFLFATQNRKFLKMCDDKFSDLQGACSYFLFNDWILKPQLGPSFIFGACSNIVLLSHACWLKHLCSTCVCVPACCLPFDLRMNTHVHVLFQSPHVLWFLVPTINLNECNYVLDAFMAIALHQFIPFIHRRAYQF